MVVQILYSVQGDQGQVGIVSVQGVHVCMGERDGLEALGPRSPALEVDSMLKKPSFVFREPRLDESVAYWASFRNWSARRCLAEGGI